MTSTARPSTTASKATSSTSTSTSTATPDPDSFVGSTVRVVMTSGIVATGTVAHVNPGSSSAALTLHNVSASFNGSTTVVAAVDIPGATIKDLTIIKAAAAVAIAAAASSQPPLRSSPADPTPPAATPFIDPAILSFTPVAAIPPPPIPSILQRHAPVSSPNASAHPAPTRQFTIPTPTSSTNGSHRPRPPIETCEEDGSTSSSSSSSSSSNNDAHARRLRISASNGSGAAKHQHHNGHAMSPKQSSSQLNHTNNNNNNNKNNKHKRNHHSQYRNGPRSQQQHQHHQQQQDTWDLGDVSDYHAHEFDFQAGLRRFDKQSVFDEIRKTDTVAPEDRLVSINRRAPPTIAKLKHTEMVLDPTTSPSPSPSPSSSSTRRRPSLASAGAAALTLPLAAPSAPSARLRTLFGVPLPSATPLQTLDALRICGLPDLVLTENAGRSIAMMVLQALGGNRRFATCNLNGPPHVVLLCGRNRAGDMTRVAGRHLRTRGVVCSVVQVGKHQEEAHVYASAVEVPATVAVDLIVDGLLGIDSVRDLGSNVDRARTYELMAWANKARAPVLSVDVPSGVDAALGHVEFAGHCVRPNWTLCIGIPKAGVVDRALTGEVYLADMGMPNEVWARVGVVGWPDVARGWRVWEDKFVVALEYVVEGATSARRKSVKH